MTTPRDYYAAADRSNRERAMPDENEELAMVLQSFRLREAQAEGAQEKLWALDLRSGSDVRTYLVSAGHLQRMASEFLTRAGPS